MSLSEHAILHRRVTQQYKGNVTEMEPTTQYVPHVLVSEMDSATINRGNTGTRIEGNIKIIIWGQEILNVQDKIELEGDINNIGQGKMFEVTKLLKDNMRQANFAVYILKRLQ